MQQEKPNLPKVLAWPSIFIFWMKGYKQIYSSIIGYLILWIKDIKIYITIIGSDYALESALGSFVNI